MSLLTKERRTEGDIINNFIQILREEGKLSKTSLFMRARVNSMTGGKILRIMINWKMIKHE